MVSTRDCRSGSHVIASGRYRVPFTGTYLKKRETASAKILHNKPEGRIRIRSSCLEVS